MTGTDSVDSGFFSLRVGQKIAVELNGRQFITRIIQRNNIPNYCCESQEVSGSVKNSATNAVSKLYQSIFHVNSKFSGSLMLGHDKKSIMQELLWDIPFRPFKIEYNKHQIWIHSLGTSENPDFLGAGPGYLSLFLYFYTKNKKKQRVLIWQTIDEDGCHIEIYCDDELLDEFHDKTPSTVWKNANFLNNTDRIGLFGLKNNITQDQLNKMHNLKCLPKDWKNELQMTKLYNHHLRKRTISAINWYSVFINLLDQSTIIELYTTGCSSITPFSRDESQQFLYEQGFLRSIPGHIFNTTETFWNCFAQALAENPCGSNGQRHILSIIADSFKYEDLQKNLKVSPNSISAAKIYSNINGHELNNSEKQ
ncbi:5009_t:CDS:2, partial [Gigaspora rosea]